MGVPSFQAGVPPCKGEKGASSPGRPPVKKATLVMNFSIRKRCSIFYIFEEHCNKKKKLGWLGFRLAYRHVFVKKRGKKRGFRVLPPGKTRERSR